MNLVNTAVSLAVANSVSQNVMGLNLRDFLFAGTAFSDSNISGWQQTGDPHNRQITLMELFRGNQKYHTDSITKAISTNMKTNALPLIIGVVGIPMLAKVATKVLRKPILTPMNRMIKMSGLDVKV